MKNTLLYQKCGKTQVQTMTSNKRIGNMYFMLFFMAGFKNIRHMRHNMVHSIL